MSEKEARVWHIILADRYATPTEIASKAGVDVGFVENLIGRIGSPNWREEAVWPQTGGVKFDGGKPRMDLLPPELMEGVADVLTFGAQKYGERNWELGMNWGRPYAALMRHMIAWWGGEDNDPETGMSHLAHAGCCIAFLMAFERRNHGTDDRPHKTEEDTYAGVAQEEGAHPKVA